MKRIISILLCLLLVLCGTTACKPDTLTNPVVITDPDITPQEPASKPEENAPTNEETAGEEQPEEEPQEETPEEETKEESPEEETEVDAPVEEPKEEEAPEEPKEEDPEEETPEEPKAEEPKEENPEEETEEEQEPAPIDHPFGEKGYTPSATVESTLPLSGFVKNTDAAAALKDRTITLFTAREEAAFNYVNQKGKTISEWDWMKEWANSLGFTLKLTVKGADRSLKAQRVALYAGKELSLLQLRQEDLAAGMTLARSAEDLVDLDAKTHGISKAVFEKSKSTLFAPMGVADSIWYNPALMPAGTDPQALAKENKWTIETYKTVYDHAAENSVSPLEGSNELAWITLSGKSPLTLLEGKLDSNLNARTTRELWAELKDLRADLKPFTPAEDLTYNLKFGNTAMAYSTLPERGEGVTLKYAPLPAMEEGTAGTVTFSGTFMALPRYHENTEADAAALTFAESWCNRFTEARAAALFETGMTIEDYVNYVDFCEANGYLIFGSPEIETLAADLLAGVSDPEVNMEDEYEKIRDQVIALIDRHNRYY